MENSTVMEVDEPAIVEATINDSVLINAGLVIYSLNLVFITPFLAIIFWYEMNAFALTHRTMINQMTATIAALVSRKIILFRLHTC